MMTTTTTITLLLLYFSIINAKRTPPVVPLTNALTAIYCHRSDSDEPGAMTIRCGPNEKIRMLDAFDAVARNKSHLPVQCSIKHRDFFSEQHISTDCKIHTSFTSACSGRENCTLHMQRFRFNNQECNNEFVDYTMAFFECISDMFIHDVCSPQAITSVWGTLQTPNFPNPYTSRDDCWCKLSTQFQHRLLLSIIVFQLIPYDQHCAGAGLYLQSSDEQRSTQCTYLEQGHNYLSDTNTLYFNFYSRTSTVRGGFWIIYEASQPNAEVHLHCGSRQTIGAPLWSISSSSNFVSPSPVSTPFDHGWSQLAFNDQTNPTTTIPINNHMMRMHLTVTTPHSPIDVNLKINTTTMPIGAFTYPHGALSTFELAYGPRGWYLKFPFTPVNTRPSNFSRRPTTTTPSTSTVVKWNSTWRYTRRPLTKRIQTTTKRTTTTTKLITTVPLTTTSTTVEFTTAQSSTPIPTTTLRTAEQRLLFTHSPWVYFSYTTDQFPSKTTTTTTTTTTMKMVPTKSTTESPSSSSSVKTTLPMPTPWYSPAGPFDWWQWQWYTTRFKKTPTRSISTTSASVSSTTTSTKTTSTTTRATTVTTTSTTTSTTTVTTTTTTTTTTRKTTPTASTIRLSNQSSTTTTGTTADWFKWPHTESPIRTTKEQDYFEEDDGDWPDTLITGKIPTSTITDKRWSISPKQQHLQQMGFFPTRSNWPLNNRIITVNTPPSKRHHTPRQTGGVAERTAAGFYPNDPVTLANVDSMIRRAIEQRNKKVSMEHGWLSKTDMTIVAVSIIFVIVLAIINLILFAVRRHRHRLQGRHLISSSMPSTLNDGRMGGGGGTNGHLHSGNLGDSTDSMINLTNNNNNNDILPAVGEIVIWDEKDQGGYMIDNDGAWSKIEGRQWFGSSLFKSCSKTSLSKSFRSRFRLMRHSEKKINHHHHQAPIIPKHPTQQQTFKFPLLMDTATLSPVPEADDYESSELSLSDVVIRSSATTINGINKRQQQQQYQQPLIKSERKHDLSPQRQQTMKIVQALIHTEQHHHHDDYYKRMGESVNEESNYTTVPGGGESSIADQETDRSLGNEVDGGGRMMIVSVPTMLRDDTDRNSLAGTVTDGTESMYNPQYSIHSLVDYSNQSIRPTYLQPNNSTSHSTGPFITKTMTSTFKPPPSILNPNASIIVGHCQAEFQPLDPKLLFKSVDTCLVDPQQFYRYSQSAQLSTYDSGFVDDQTTGSMATTAAIGCSGSENNLTITGPPQQQDEMSGDDILLTKSEDDDDDDDERPVQTTELRNSNRQKWRQIVKRVSFQEEHVTERFSPPPPPPPDPSSHHHPFDTYDVLPDVLPHLSSPRMKSFFPSTTTTDPSKNVFIVQKQQQQTTSIDAIDNDDCSQTIIMNHLHSVKSLKKFFETKMVGQQRSSSTVVQATTTTNLQNPINPPPPPVDEPKLSNKETLDIEQRHEIMNKVLASLKKKKVYSRGAMMNDNPESNNDRCSALTTSSYDSNIANQHHNLPFQRHYSRRFRSSSTSNNSLCPGGQIVTHILPPSPSHPYHVKRALSHERQQYQLSSNLRFGDIEKWKQEHRRQQQQQQQSVQDETDEEDNISENSMLWQARTKLNEFVSRTRKNLHPPPSYGIAGCPSDDGYTFDDNQSVTAETRF